MKKDDGAEIMQRVSSKWEAVGKLARRWADPTQQFNESRVITK